MAATSPWRRFRWRKMMDWQAERQSEGPDGLVIHSSYHVTFGDEHKSSFSETRVRTVISIELHRLSRRVQISTPSSWTISLSLLAVVGAALYRLYVQVPRAALPPATRCRVHFIFGVRRTRLLVRHYLLAYTICCFHRPSTWPMRATSSPALGLLIARCHRLTIRYSVSAG